MSRPDDSLSRACENPGAQMAQRNDPVVVKCPSCRELTRAVSLNSIRKNFQLLDLLKLYKSATKLLADRITTGPSLRIKDKKNVNKKSSALLESQASVASAAMTLSDLGDTWEPKLLKAARATQAVNDQNKKLVTNKTHRNAN